MTHAVLRKILGTIIVLGGLVFVVAFFIKPAPLQSFVCKKCNVILISLDSFGADHSTVYTADLATTPFLESLARDRGIVFDHAYASSPLTLPSEGANLTGSYPWELNMGEFGVLPSKPTTIAEALRDNGYYTAAFSDGPFIQPTWHFDRGFEEFHGSLLVKDWNDAPQLFDTAASWLATHTASAEEKPFFLFMHAFELHAPFGDLGKPHTVSLEDIVAANTKPGGPTAADAARFEDAYHTELKITDESLRSFFATLDAMHLSENTIVIITSEHGIEFGEHGTAGLSVALYEESIHVPLIIVLPSATPQRISPTVETRSIPPTILDLVGVSDPFVFESKSLVPFLNGLEKANRLVLSRTSVDRDTDLAVIRDAPTGAEKVDVPYEPVEAATSTNSYTASAILGPWQILRRNGNLELYDMNTDPGETTNALGNPSRTSSQDQAVIQKLIQSLLLKQ